MENVLITGTTSGFGKAFAEKFASMGNNIILVSRDMQKLQQQQLYLQNQYHATVKFIAYDLTKEDAADFIMEQIDNFSLPPFYHITLHALLPSSHLLETVFRYDL